MKFLFAAPALVQKSVRLVEFAPALATAFLVLCLTITKGFMPSHGKVFFPMCLLTASWISCLAALCFPNAKLPRFAKIPVLRIAARDPVLVLLILCLAVQWLALCQWYLADQWFFGIVPLFLLPAVWSIKPSIKSSSKIWYFAMASVLLFVICTALVFRFFTDALMDVAVFQRDSPLALVRGQNPYDITFPDMYTGSDSSRFYGPGASVGGVLQFGFPYMPLTLLWVFPAQILLGDFRYAHVLALVIAAFCIFRLRKTPVAAASALLLLFSMPTFFVLQFGWTEPLPVMLLCVAALASRHKKSSSFLTVGLLAAAKQYLVLLFPLIFLLPEEKTPTQRIQDLAKAIAVAAIVTLPFVLWNPRAFFHSALFIQIAQPFRDDSLSYLSLFKLLTGTQPPSWPGFVIAIIALAFCLWRAPRTTTGFTLSVALVMFGFIVFARQAFINYYFLIFGALCCATALANSETEAELEAELVTSSVSAAAQ